MSKRSEAEQREIEERLARAERTAAHSQFPEEVLSPLISSAFSDPENPTPDKRRSGFEIIEMDSIERTVGPYWYERTPAATLAVTDSILTRGGTSVSRKIPANSDRSTQIGITQENAFYKAQQAIELQRGVTADRAVENFLELRLLENNEPRRVEYADFRAILAIAFDNPTEATTELNALLEELRVAYEPENKEEVSRFAKIEAQKGSHKQNLALYLNKLAMVSLAFSAISFHPEDDRRHARGQVDENLLFEHTYSRESGGKSGAKYVLDIIDDLMESADGEGNLLISGEVRTRLLARVDRARLAFYRTWVEGYKSNLTDRPDNERVAFDELYKVEGPDIRRELAFTMTGFYDDKNGHRLFSNSVEYAYGLREMPGGTFFSKTNSDFIRHEDQVEQFDRVEGDSELLSQRWTEYFRVTGRPMILENAISFMQASELSYSQRASLLLGIHTEAEEQFVRLMSMVGGERAINLYRDELRKLATDSVDYMKEYYANRRTDRKSRGDKSPEEKKKLGDAMLLAASMFVKDVSVALMQGKTTRGFQEHDTIKWAAELERFALDELGPTERMQSEFNRQYIEGLIRAGEVGAAMKLFKSGRMFESEHAIDLMTSFTACYALLSRRAGQAIDKELLLDAAHDVFGQITEHVRDRNQALQGTPNVLNKRKTMNHVLSRLNSRVDTLRLAYR